MYMRKINFLLVAVVCVSLLAMTYCAVSAKTTVTRWFAANPAPANQWLQEFAAEFNRNNPDIELVIDSSFTSNGRAREKLVVAMAGGAAPDICNEAQNYLPYWIGNNAAFPIERYVSQMPDKDRFIPDIMREVQMGGHTWALPYAVYGVYDIYNLDLLENAGVPEPKTWDDMLRLAGKITRVDAQKQIDIFGYRSSRSWSWAILDLLVGFDQSGGSILTKDGQKAAINNTIGTRVLGYQRDLWLAGMGDNAGGTSMAAILQQKVAVQHSIEDTAWQQQRQAIVNSGIKFGLRRIVGPEKGTDRVIYGASDLFMVSTTKHPDEAWRVMQAFIEPSHLKAYLMAQGAFYSVRINQLSDPDLLARPFAREAMAGLISPMIGQGLFDFKYLTYRQPAGEELLKALNGQTGINNALELAENRINTTIKEMTGGK